MSVMRFSRGRSQSTFRKSMIAFGGPGSSRMDSLRRAYYQNEFNRLRTQAPLAHDGVPAYELEPNFDDYVVR